MRSIADKRFSGLRVALAAYLEGTMFCTQRQFVFSLAYGKRVYLFDLRCEHPILVPSKGSALVLTYCGQVKL